MYFFYTIELEFYVEEQLEISISLMNQLFSLIQYN